MTEDQDPTRIDIRFDPTVQRMSGYATHGMTPFDVPFISEIVPNLWQGGCEDGLVLPEHITDVVSLYKWEKYTIFHDASFEVVTMYDAAETPDRGEVERLAQLVNDKRRAGGTVLVHCQAGLNRSGLIAAVALVLNGDVETGAEAIALLRETRSPAVLCNPAFAVWVKETYG